MSWRAGAGSSTIMTLAAGTWLATADGPRRVDELAAGSDGSTQMLVQRGGSRIEARVGVGVDNGNGADGQTLYRVVLESGLMLRAGGNHRLLAINNGRNDSGGSSGNSDAPLVSISLGELASEFDLRLRGGDRVRRYVVCQRHDAHGEGGAPWCTVRGTLLYVSAQAAEFCALFYGDNIYRNVETGSYVLRLESNASREHVCALVAAQFDAGDVHVLGSGSSGSGSSSGSNNSVELSWQLSRLVAREIGDGSTATQLPTFLMQASRDEKLAFLRALAAKYTWRPQGFQCIYQTPNESLANELAVLVRTFRDACVILERCFDVRGRGARTRVLVAGTVCACLWPQARAGSSNNSMQTHVPQERVLAPAEAFEEPARQRAQHMTPLHMRSAYMQMLQRGRPTWTLRATLDLLEIQVAPHEYIEEIRSCTVESQQQQQQQHTFNVALRCTAATAKAAAAAVETWPGLSMWRPPCTLDVHPPPSWGIGDVLRLQWQQQRAGNGNDDAGACTCSDAAHTCLLACGVVACSGPAYQ